ncbi:glycosyltransferase family 15 protein [Tricholoma matsutake]|nr:glycosyltransferase family 15 protein [Tricholoma matsutake 945]
MMTQFRYIIAVLTIVISLHYILSFSHDGYGRVVSFSNMKSKIMGSQSRPPTYKKPQVSDDYLIHDKISPTQRKADAVFVVLARNRELEGVVTSVKQMEDRFNKKYQYPYVFLNDEPFDENFKKRVAVLTDAPIQFGLIPVDHWIQPLWINETKASAARESMAKTGVIYADSVSYRNMCRFNSGFFYRHELLKPYKYYWRIEPDIKYFCDLDYDPFLFMQDNNKVYGFTISLYEFIETIPTLWDAVKDFIGANPGFVSADNAMGFLSDDGGDTYNRCHFWSNFEIGNLDFWRGEAYSKFFDFLDQKGGFYYERWGDAPVHSIGAALFAKKDQVHFFSDIGSFILWSIIIFTYIVRVGYRHGPYQHCPQEPVHSKGKCWCDSKDSFDYDGYSCLRKYDAIR